MDASKQLHLAALMILLICLPSQLSAQGDHDDAGPVQIGYAVITPVPPSPGRMLVFETFGLKRGSETIQAGVLPDALTVEASMFVNLSRALSRNSGVAMANPSDTDAQVSLTMVREDGFAVGEKTIFIPPRRQVSAFVSQLFADVPSVPSELTGFLKIRVSTPIALVGLRFRGSNFSTVPVTNHRAFSAVPALSPGVGGAGAVMLAHAALGGGWSSEIIVVNDSAAFLGIRVDLFRQDGSPLTARLNGARGSTFYNLSIPPGGVAVFAPREAGGQSRF